MNTTLVTRLLFPAICVMLVATCSGYHVKVTVSDFVFCLVTYFAEVVEMPHCQVEGEELAVLCSQGGRGCGGVAGF